MAAISEKNYPLFLPENRWISRRQCSNGTGSIELCLCEQHLFRTPDSGSHNCLFIASRERFARNMSSVKHLLLCSETPLGDEETRLTCFEKCRAMRHRKYAELILRPLGKGLASLTIPFEIFDQDWSLISDLLVPPTAEFLAIDNCYCEILMTGSRNSKELPAPADKFSNLKALTIYRSSEYEIDKLCELLQCCDLQLLHLQERCLTGKLDSNETAKLLGCIRRQQNLTALALIMPCYGLLPESTSTTLERDEYRRNPWPNLKALYLRVEDQCWLEQLPDFEELQILSLQRLDIRVTTINRNAIKKIAKCRHLRAVELSFNEISDIEALLDIARGCSLLKRFSARYLECRGNPKLTENLFCGLLRGLPHLEFLELGLKFRMDGAKLQDLARHCPRLTVLDLAQARLYTSFALMRKAHPFRRLKGMRLAEIWFEDPRRFMKRDEIQSIATKWRRIFPSLRTIPCNSDVYPYRGEDNSSEDSEEDRASEGTDEVPLNEPELDFNGYGSDWMIYGGNFGGFLIIK